MQQLVKPKQPGMARSMRPAWAEVRLDHLAHNIRRIRKRVGRDIRIMAVVKANAYGHGSVEVAKVLLEQGADRLAVALVDEGVELRRAGIEAPVLVLGMFGREEADVIVRYGLTPMVCTTEGLRDLQRVARKFHKTVRFHLRVDPGMGSVGIPMEECKRFLHEAGKYPDLFPEGLFTHLPSAYGGTREEVEEDLRHFNGMLAELTAAGLRPPLVHAASSPGILNFPASYFDMVRPGIMLYGLPVYEGCADPELKPVMRLKSRIVYQKDVRAGTKLGYGNRWHAERNLKLATVPIGYGDGLFLFFMEGGEVLIHGQKAPIFGQVYMDHFMIDVTEIAGTAVGDEVVLIGRQGESRITSAEVADRSGIGGMHCDCVHLLSSRIPRVYIGKLDESFRDGGLS